MYIYIYMYIYSKTEASPSKKELALDEYQQLKTMVKSYKWEIRGSRDVFNKFKGNLSQLEELKNDLRTKQHVITKVKKSLDGVVGNAEAMKTHATSGFFQETLKEAKEKKKQLFAASQRLECILEENEDTDGQPVTWAALKATLGKYKKLFVYIYL